MMDPSAARLQAQLTASIEGMLQVITTHSNNQNEEGRTFAVGVGSTFLEEFRKLSLAMEKHCSLEILQEAFAGLEVSPSSSSNRDQTVALTTDMKASLEAHANYMLFLTEHVKDGVPTDKDNPSTWSTSRLIQYLKAHSIHIQQTMTMPNDRYNSFLVEMAHHMVHFCRACTEIVRSIPDDDQAGVLGRASLMMAGDDDTSTGTTTPAEMQQLIMEKLQLKANAQPKLVPSQIPAHFALSLCTKILQDDGCCHQIFEQEHAKYKKANDTSVSSSSTECDYNSSTRSSIHAMDEVWGTVTRVAHVYQMIWDNPGQDYCLMVMSSTDDEQQQQHPSTVLAIRPIGLRMVKNNDDQNQTTTTTNPFDEAYNDNNWIPLLQVEYVFIQHESTTTNRQLDMRATLEAAGLRPGTQLIECSLTAPRMDILHDLLQVNAAHLDTHDDDFLSETKDEVTPQWMFSVLRPVQS